ncbi:hypothetical protein AUJ14_00920 [Candidatus Micrarchaeota archaeon CG1_02_55_22]|nr:MAG: hypothetical protein AUJ14_00920 [Candidatus Micrarchaeota archaeon CG1_02_55_22]
MTDIDGAWLSELESKVVSTKGTWIYLFEPDSDTYLRQGAKLVKKMQDLDYFCIYISLNRPHADLAVLLENESVDSKKVFFADAVTIQAGGERANSDNVVYLESPRDLTDLSIAIDALAPKLITGKKFVFFDSLTTLLLYHQPNSVARFIHFLTSKLRSQDVNGMLVALPQDAEALALLKQFCDGTLKTT